MIRLAQRSATGKVREANEDAVLVRPEVGLFAVADGMGGCSAGEEASRLVGENLRDWVQADDFRRRSAEVDRAVVAANTAIRAYAKRHGYEQMGSTLALLALESEDGRRGLVGHAGDSRVYRVRAGEVELLTRDHTLGTQLAEEVGGKMGARLLGRENPFAHILTRAIGTEEVVALDWRKIDVKPADRYLVCSDGVHDVIEAEELAELLADRDLEKSAQCLEKEILARGAPDNYSFVLVEIGGAK